MAWFKLFIILGLVRVEVTMLQDRFCNPAILSIENEVAKSIDYTDVVDDFASIKARKVL